MQRPEKHHHFAKLVGMILGDSQLVWEGGPPGTSCLPGQVQGAFAASSMTYHFKYR